LSGGGEMNMLGTAEQFAHVLGQIPHLRERVQCFKYMVDFEPKKVDLKPDIDTLSKCSQLIKDDPKLEKILEIVLHVGNFLNAGNNRLGAAIGFTLETISKLYDTKTTDNKSSIFEILVEMIKDQDNKLLLFTKEELELIENGARVSLQTVESELKKLRKDYDAMAKTAPTIEPTGPEDKFQSRFSAFMEKATEELSNMEKDLSASQKKYEEIVNLWREDPKKMGPEEFFVVWKTFVSKIVETSEKIDVEREKAEKLRKREEAKKKREDELAAKAAAAAASTTTTAEGGAPAEGTTGEGEPAAGAGGPEGEGGAVAPVGGVAPRGRGRGAGGMVRGRGRGRGGGGAPDENSAQLVADLMAKVQGGGEKKN